MHGLWLGWVLWFGVIDSGITTNYLLLPVSFMMIAIAVDAQAILVADRAPARRYFSAPSRPAFASVLGLVLIVAVDQWRTTSLDQARPTISAPGIDAITSIHSSSLDTRLAPCSARKPRNASSRASIQGPGPHFPR